MTTIDMTRTSWGNSFNVIDWAKGTLFVWVTPGPCVGDILLLPGHKGIIRTVIAEAQWVTNVDDMHKIRVVPEPSDEGSP